MLFSALTNEELLGVLERASSLSESKKDELLGVVTQRITELTIHRDNQLIDLDKRLEEAEIKYENARERLAEIVNLANL